MRYSHRYFVAVLFFIITVAACNSSDSSGSKTLDSATQGNISIAADESFEPLLHSEIRVFESIYKYAHLRLMSGTENEAIQALLNDSVRLAFVGRDFNEQEKAAFKQQSLLPRSNKFAVDAVCLIVNKKNNDTLLTLAQIATLLDGKAPRWSDLQHGGLKDSVRIVLDNNHSSNLHYLEQRFQIAADNSAAKRIFAAKSNNEVIEYVKKNPAAMGIIGLSWISDKSDTIMRSFNKDIGVVAVADMEKPSYNKDDYHRPFQYELLQGNYPLTRDIYILSREARAGLGTGFSSFLLGDKGQRVVLQAGLLPVTQPIRAVQLKNQDIEVE